MANLLWEKQDQHDTPDSGKLSVTFIEPNGWYEACVRWDGCMEFKRYFNTPFGGDSEDPVMDRVHICDIDDLIKRLEALKVCAKEHFDEDWPW